MCGLRNNAIHKGLLSEVNLSSAKDVEIAQGLEAVEGNAKRLQGGETTHVSDLMGREDKCACTEEAG